MTSRLFGKALITTGIIIARIIKQRGEKSRNQYRIPFAAVVKTREMGVGGREEMDGGREGGRKGGRCGGGVVMCE